MVKLPLLVLPTAVKVPPLVTMMDAPSRTATEPSMRNLLLLTPVSTRKTELAINSAPPLLIVHPLIIRSGVPAPTLVICRVFTTPPGAPNAKSLIVRLVDGVEELIVTVLDTVLVMKIPVCLTVDGGTPNDQ